MQWWYYRGQVTTPIDIPGKGPTVLRPRDKFQAPFAAVAHLSKLKMVVKCKAPKEAKEKKVAPKIEPEVEKNIEKRAVVPATVVASKEPIAEITEQESKDEEEKTEESQEEKASWYKEI